MARMNGKIPVYETEDVQEETPDYPNLPTRDYKQSEDVVPIPLKPQLAFERFAGAIYDSQTAEFGDSLKIRQVSADRDFFGTGPKGKHAAVFQSPLQRYSELKEGVNSFMNDLQELAKELKESKDANNVMPKEATELLTQQLASMKEQLSSIEQDESQKQLLQSTFPVNVSSLKQQALTEQLATQIAKISEAKKDEAPGTSDKASPGRIEYQLYCQADKGTAHLAGLASLDKRVAHLEKLIGQKKRVIGVKYPDLHSAIHYLKKRVELLDKQKLDSISHRIKRLLGDLMRLSKETRAASIGASDSKDPKSGGPGLPSREQIMSHHQKVNAVYDALTRYQETAEQLPHVIDRLKSLRSLHEHSAQAISRLNKLEQRQMTLDAVLKQNQQMLQRMEKSFQTNMKIMQANTKVFEEKFAKISSALSSS